MVTAREPTEIGVEAFLADTVEALNGKLYAMGAGWNIIRTPAVPVRHDRIGLGILIRVPYSRTNEPHRLAIEMVDADGQTLPVGEVPEKGKLEKIGAEFTVGRPPELQPGDEQIVPFALNINGMAFEKAGRYAFVFRIDEEERARLPFRVVVVAQMQPMS